MLMRLPQNLDGDLYVTRIVALSPALVNRTEIPSFRTVGDIPVKRRMIEYIRNFHPGLHANLLGQVEHLGKVHVQLAGSRRADSRRVRL